MGSHKMTTVLLLLLHLLPFSQSAPEPDTHLHVHLPPEGGQGETPNIGGGRAADDLKAKKGRDGNRALSDDDKDEIAGGVKVKPHEFPFLPVFYHKSTSWTGGCAGALISPRHVITVWHCFQEKVSKQTQVGFHKTDRDDEEGVVKRQVQRFVFHPTLDVGILVLKSKVDDIEPIRLPEDDGCDYNGEIITVVGPGATGLPGSANAPDSVFMK